MYVCNFGISGFHAGRLVPVYRHSGWPGMQTQREQGEYMKKLILVALAIGMTAIVNAQERGLPADVHYPAGSSAGYGKCRFADLWTFRVNAAEFLFTVPNAGIEADLSRSPYNRLSLGVDVRYRWNWRSAPTNWLANVVDVKPELKYWWRGSSVSRFAWYGGVYGNAGTFRYKFGKSRDGKVGDMYGAGLSAGFSRPLYQYRRCALDLEVGLSAGFLSTRSDTYTVDDSGYTTQTDNSWKVLPYPVLSQLRVALALRSMSVNDKYRKVREQKLARRQERRLR